MRDQVPSNKLELMWCQMCNKPYTLLFMPWYRMPLNMTCSTRKTHQTSSTRITTHQNLVRGDYTVNMVNDELRIGQGIWNLIVILYIVIVMYQKTMVKCGRHEPTDVTSNIAAFMDCSSGLGTQQSWHPLLLHSGTNCIASSIPTCPAPTNKFSYPSEYPTIESKLKINNSRFQLSPVNMVLFNDLKKGKEQLKKALKAFRK